MKLVIDGLWFDRLTTNDTRLTIGPSLSKGRPARTGTHLTSAMEAARQSPEKPKILGPGEGKKTPMRGGEQTVKVPREVVDGAFGLWESTIEGGPGPHIHHTSEEAFYVLEGEVDFKLGDVETRVTRGGFVLIPRGAVHSFSTVGPGPAKLLVIMSPGGFEHWFDVLESELASSGGDRGAAVKASGAKFNTEFL